MEVTILGIDLAKNIFQLHGIGKRGEVLVRKKLTRSKLRGFVRSLGPCLIGMEACSGAHYWAREFLGLGHEVKLMAPQYVKAYVKTNKNDQNDAEAICEAVQRPTMRFVQIKSEEQQEVQSLHRIRQRLVWGRTALINEVRGILGEYGYIIAQGRNRFEAEAYELQANGELRPQLAAILKELMSEYFDINKKIEIFEAQIERVHKQSELSQRIEKIPGFGVLTSTALVSAVGEARNFKSGRELSAWLGLVPRQNSSGGKERLGGISKRGDVYLRTLMIHGARAVIRAAEKKTDSRSIWLQEKIKTRGKNITAVALANKNARVAWKLLSSRESYKMAA